MVDQLAPDVKQKLLALAIVLYANPELELTDKETRQTLEGAIRTYYKYMDDLFGYLDDDDPAGFFSMKTGMALAAKKVLGG